MVGLYGERIDNTLMVLQILVPLHEITTLVESFVFVNSLFYFGVSNLVVTPGWFFPPNFSASLRKQDFFYSSARILFFVTALLSLINQIATLLVFVSATETLSVSLLTPRFWGLMSCCCVKCFAFMTWTRIPGYSNGIRLAWLSQGWL